jgi:hypothetical protein
LVGVTEPLLPMHGVDLFCMARRIRWSMNHAVFWVTPRARWISQELTPFLSLALIWFESPDFQRRCGSGNGHILVWDIGRRRTCKNRGTNELWKRRAFHPLGNAPGVSLFPKLRRPLKLISYCNTFGVWSRSPTKRFAK